MTESRITDLQAMNAAKREAELYRIIEEKNEQIKKLRHALNRLEQKHGHLTRSRRGSVPVKAPVLCRECVYYDRLTGDCAEICHLVGDRDYCSFGRRIEHG